MALIQFIRANNLRPADAVELVCPQVGFPKHYAIYLGIKNGLPEFIANITGGIQILSMEKLLEFIKRYQVTNIERFKGNHLQRHHAVLRAINRIGEKAYNLVFNNCEHFKNWVLNGEGVSTQAASAVTGIAVVGTMVSLIGVASESKGFKKAGSIILIVLLVVLVIAFVLWQYEQNQDEGFNN